MSLHAMFLQAIAISRWGKRKEQDLAAKLEMPVSTVNRDNDPMVPIRDSAELSRRPPHAKLIIYNKAGHRIFQNHSDFFLEVSKSIFQARL